MIDIFHQYLDALYYPGFAEQLLKDDRERYNFEYQAFLRFYPEYV